MRFKSRMINAAVAAALGTVAGAASAAAFSPDVLMATLTPVSCSAPSALVPSVMVTNITIVNSDSVPGRAVKVRIVDAGVSIGSGTSNQANHINCNAFA